MLCARAAAHTTSLTPDDSLSLLLRHRDFLLSCLKCQTTLPCCPRQEHFLVFPLGAQIEILVTRTFCLGTILWFRTFRSGETISSNALSLQSFHLERVNSICVRFILLIQVKASEFSQFLPQRCIRDHPSPGIFFDRDSTTPSGAHHHSHSQASIY